ncbi:MAG: rhamnogalacturonan lyase B N-terminal domain-containing protein [Verrucomicrobiota bacterium]
MSKPAKILSLVLWLLLCGPLLAAFSLTTATDFYTVDTNAGLVFKVRRTDNGSSTQSAGDLASMVYNGVEYQNTSRGSQLNSGFDFLYNGVSAVTVDAVVVNTDYIKVTVVAGNLTHYYMARNGFPQIYMATYFTTEPDTLGLCRYIVRIPSALLPNGPVPSDIRNNTGAIESADIFGMADGTTRSKHYSNMRLKDWSYIGATGTNVGMWMLRSNHEGDSGGPFYRSLLMQTGTDQEITYIINYGEAQTEAFRTHILNGPYVLSFTNGAAPTGPDTSWVANMGLTGFVGTAGRGGVSATGITGRDTTYPFTVGFANTTAQYWTDAAAGSGAFSKTDMLPGTYTMKVYKNELAVYTADVTVTAGANTALGSLAIAADPSATVPLWRIGNWDGTPNEFLNGDKVTTMHPSDVRITPTGTTTGWNPGVYVIGSSVPATGMPCYQWKDVNGTQAIQFQLTAGQLVASTVRIGLTCAFEGARPKISVNSYNSANPTPSSQPDTRTLTVGTYRGNNVTYSFAVPGSAFVAGTNTLWVTPISGSGATGYLSAGYSIDSIDLYQGTAQTLPLPAAPTGLSANAAGSAVSLSWSAASGATGYTVQRATVSGGPYVTVASGIGTTSYTDTGLTIGTTYYYVVRGSNSSGSGPNSAEASATAGGLVAWYTFDGNAQDVSGNANHGAASAVTYPIDGNAAQTGLFNGTSSHVVIPRSIQDDFTVALWMKATGTGGTGTQWWSGDGMVDGEVNGSAADWGLSLLNGKVAFGIGATDITFASTSNVNDGQWHHVAATRKSTGGAIQIYVDGSLQTSGTGPAGTRTAPPSLRIGSLQTGAAASFFNGGLDGVRLYNKVLTATEIAAISSAGLQTPAAPTGLVATPVGASQVNLTWTASPTAVSYTVKRATVSGGPYTMIASGLTAINFSDPAVTAFTHYHYVVSATNANGEGANSAEASATPLPPPPLVHLRFDENSGTVASNSSGVNWNGTLVNGPSWATGMINNAVALDGNNDHVTLPAGVVSSLNDFTMAVWVKWTGSTDWQRAIDFGTGTTNYLFFSPRAGSGTARFAIRTPAVPEQVIDGPPLTGIGGWTHVAITLSGTTGTLYINGVSVGTNAAMTLKPSSLGGTTNNYLGKSQFVADANLNGSLDEFQIHSRALSPAEIAALAAPPPAPAGVTASPGNAQVALTWNAVAGATGYNVKRATVSGGPYTTLISNFVAAAYTDAAVTNGTTYYYAITTAATAAESARSADVSATPVAPPPAPASLTATGGNAQVALSWNATAGAASYTVKRSLTSGSGYATLTTVAATGYTDTGLTNGTPYHYVVSASNAGGTSADSTQASATPLSAIQAWRLANFGSYDNTGDAADNADPDGDGTLNETEFRLGLDPKHGSSAFKASGAHTPAGFVLTWPSAAGLTFEIRRGSAPGAIGELIGSVTGIGTFTDTTPPPGAAFYRIVLLP